MKVLESILEFFGLYASLKRLLGIAFPPPPARVKTRAVMKVEKLLPDNTGVESVVYLVVDPKMIKQLTQDSPSFDLARSEFYSDQPEDRKNIRCSVSVKESNTKYSRSELLTYRLSQCVRLLQGRAR